MRTLRATPDPKSKGAAGPKSPSAPASAGKSRQNLQPLTPAAAEPLVVMPAPAPATVVVPAMIIAVARTDMDGQGFCRRNRCAKQAERKNRCNYCFHGSLWVVELRDKATPLIWTYTPLRPVPTGGTHDASMNDMPVTQFCGAVAVPPGLRIVASGSAYI